MLTIAATRTEPTGFNLMAHIMGMAARRRGEGVMENPFTDEPGASDAWLDGWMQASTNALAH